MINARDLKIYLITPNTLNDINKWSYPVQTASGISLFLRSKSGIVVEISTMDGYLLPSSMDVNRVLGDMCGTLMFNDIYDSVLGVVIVTLELTGNPPSADVLFKENMINNNHICVGLYRSRGSQLDYYCDRYISKDIIQGCFIQKMKSIDIDEDNSIRRTGFKPGNEYHNSMNIELVMGVSYGYFNVNPITLQTTCKFSMISNNIRRSRGRYHYRCYSSRDETLTGRLGDMKFDAKITGFKYGKPLHPSDISPYGFYIDHETLNNISGDDIVTYVFNV